MKPFTERERVEAGGSMERVPSPGSKYSDSRSDSFEDLANHRPEQGLISSKTKCVSSKSVVGNGNSCRPSPKKAEESPSAADDFALRAAGSSIAADPRASTSSISAPAAAAFDGVAGSPSPIGATAERLQSTLLTLTARRLPAGPLPKMDEVIARFMNISPKQWQLLNATIDELNGRFKQGALHWLLLRWLVAAHPEQFFPPPFNSYQQLLQHVSQKDADIQEAKKEAVKWRNACVRLDAEHKRWKNQLQQMEKEVNGVYSRLTERQDARLNRSPERVVPQQTKKCDNVCCGAATKMRATASEAVKNARQLHHCQLTKRDEQQQQHQYEQQDHQHGDKEERSLPNLQEHVDQQDEKQPAGLLLHQLAHPVSAAHCASSGHPGGNGETVQQRKEEGTPENLSRATTTTRAKTTVTTTTKSSSTSSHSVSVTRETEGPTSPPMDATSHQLEDALAQKAKSLLQAHPDVCEREETCGEASLAGILGCMQNLLRRITTENKGSFVLSSSIPSLQESDEAGIAAFTPSNKKNLNKRHERKLRKKNVELWYLQYRQHHGPFAGSEGEKRKKKQQLQREKFSGDKKKKHQEQEKHQRPNARSSSDEEDIKQGKEKEPPTARDQMCADNLANGNSRTELQPTADRDIDPHVSDINTNDCRVEQGRRHLPPSLQRLSPKAAESASYMANAALPQQSPASTEPEEYIPAETLRQVSQHSYPVTEYIRRFMDLYTGKENIPETIGMRIFIHNLKPELSLYVKARHPTSLAHAIVLARQGEKYGGAAVPEVLKERIGTGGPLLNDSCKITVLDSKIEGRTSKQHHDVDETEDERRIIQLGNCAGRAVSSRVSSGTEVVRQHLFKDLQQKNEAAIARQKAKHQWHEQRWQDPQEVRQLQGKQVPEQQQQQFLSDFDTLNEDVWHSNINTMNGASNAYVMRTAGRDVRQQEFGVDDQQNEVPPLTEKALMEPRQGSAKESCAEKTHIIGRVSMSQDRNSPPRNSRSFRK